MLHRSHPVLPIAALAFGLLRSPAAAAQEEAPAAADAPPAPPESWTAPDPAGPAALASDPGPTMPSPPPPTLAELAPPPTPPVRYERRSVPLLVSGVVVGATGVPVVAVGFVAFVLGAGGTLGSIRGDVETPLPGPKMMLGGALLMGVGTVPIAVGMAMADYGRERIPVTAADEARTPARRGAARTARAVRAASPAPTVRIAPTGASVAWTF